MSKFKRGFEFMGIRPSKLGRMVVRRGSRRLGAAPTTPRGYVPVCVGVDNETKRFIVRMRALGDAEFLQMLYKSAEEYGFCNEGVLRIPFEAKDFEERMAKGSRRKFLRIKPI